MNTGKMLRQPLRLQDLLNYKALSPLSDADRKTLENIRSLKIDDFSEAEVRSSIIDPIVRILGYDIAQDFAPRLEKSLAFRGRKKFIDYKLTLWTEGFWIIEAKKPSDASEFPYDDLSQAFEYAAHPSINAALVVLCDGNKIEVFDREESVTEHILLLNRSELADNFDKLRVLLEPWQVWLFQKRRVLRALDKAFDREFNIGRITEFGKMVETQLSEKRGTVFDNYRLNVKSSDRSAEAWAANAPAEELIEIALFYPQTVNVTRAVIDRLVKLAAPRSFPVIHQLLGNRGRPANETYYAYAAAFLAALSEKSARINFVPSWLSENISNPEPNKVARRLIGLCLSNFSGEPIQRTVIALATSVRRLLKLLLFISEGTTNFGQSSHIFERFFTSESSWQQIVSSPGRHLLIKLDLLSMRGLQLIIGRFHDPDNEFKLEQAKLELKQLWSAEIQLLRSVNYRQLLKEYNAIETRGTEQAGIIHDFLAHSTLCFLGDSDYWRKVLTTEFHSELENVMRLGSPKAKTLLGVNPLAPIEPLSENTLADRFFNGDVRQLKALREAYGF